MIQSPDRPPSLASQLPQVFRAFTNPWSTQNPVGAGLPAMRPANPLEIPAPDPLAQKLEIFLTHISRLIRQMMPRFG